MSPRLVAPVECLHGGYVQGRRLRRLSELLAPLLPRNARVLDVGCGDGELSHAILGRRPDLSIRGLDVLVRDGCRIPVERFDGHTIPLDDDSCDVALLVDVVHHADDPMALLREANRVAAHGLLIKDHLLQGFLAGPTLRFMDYVGNARYGVALPHNYWTPERWRRAFRELCLSGDWQCDLGLYPWPAGWLFDRSMHFVARLQGRIAI